LAVRDQVIEAQLLVTADFQGAGLLGPIENLSV